MPELENAQAAFCQTVLLDDSPTSEDAFHHQEIALAISRMVLREDGGRAIALTGEWGSGKSTVIQLLKEDFASAKSDARVITFDAWAHQGDPLRRTFLEHAVKELHDWIPDQERWDRKLKILAGRLLLTETKTTPNVTRWGAFGALSLLLSPVGLALPSFLKEIMKTVTLKWTVVAFLLTSAPLIWSLTLIARWAFLKLRNQKEPLPSLTYTSTEDTKQTESTQTTEPTSIEFELNYAELLSDVIGTQNRKILFVIDNLDRLSDDEAKSIWSTLRTFFDAPLRSQSWYKNVWILVPFDERAVARLWKDGPDQEALQKRAHFIEKTFQAFFRVPPPILTGWEHFIISQLGIALPEHKGDVQLRTIFRLYDEMRPADSSAPTPREVKLFVNTLGSLHRQWQHSIPLVTQAAFVLKLTKNGGGFIKELQEASARKFLPDSVTAKLPGKWQQDMAAMFFNVSQSDAFEALLQNPIDNALKSGDSAEIRRLESSSGFPEVLERTVTNHYESIDAQSVLNITNALAGLTKLCPEYRDIQQILFSRAVSVEKWPGFNAETGRCLVEIAKYASGQDIRPLLISIANSLSSKADIAPWCEGVSVSLSYFIEHHESSVTSSFTVSGDEEGYVAAVSQMEETNPAFPFRCFRGRVTPDSVIRHLCILATGGWGQDESSAVRVLAPINADWDWPSVARQLAERIGATEQVALSLQYMIESLKTILALHNGDLRDEVVSFVSTHYGFRAYQELSGEGEAEASAYLASLLIASGDALELKQPQNVQVNYRWQPQPLSALDQDANSAKEQIKSLLEGRGEPVYLEAVYRNAIDRWTLGEWRSIAEHDPTRLQFVKSLASFAAEKDTTDQALPVGELIEHLGFWSDLLGVDSFTALATDAARSGELCLALEGREYDSNFDPLYLTALREGDSEQLCTLVRDGLQTVSEQGWTEELEVPSERLDLVTELSGSGLCLGQAFENALFTEAEKAISG